MKKIIFVTLILSIIFLSTANCFAAIFSENYTDSSPYYVGTRSHEEVFIISNSGQATMDVMLKPLNSSAIDKVMITLTIKNSSGTTVYNKSYDSAWSNVDGAYCVIKNYQLESAGRYTFQATYKCYKKNTLIETIKSEVISKSF